MTILGELLALANAALFAASSIFNRKALDKMDKDAGMVITLIVNCILYFLILLALLFTGAWVPFSADSLFWFVLAGLLTSLTGRYLLLESVNLNGPSRAGAFKVASPVFTLFIGIMILGEHLEPVSILGAAVVITGLFLISIRNVKQKAGQKAGRQSKPALVLTSKGVIIGLGSGLSYAIGQITRKVGLAIWPFSPGGALVGALAALLGTLIWLMVTRRQPLPWRQMASRDGIDYVWSGVCTGIAILLFFFALLYIPVSIANVLGAVEPLVTIVMAYFMLRSRESFSLNLILGATAVTIGTAVIMFS